MMKREMDELSALDALLEQTEEKEEQRFSKAIFEDNKYTIDEMLDRGYMPTDKNLREMISLRKIELISLVIQGSCIKLDESHLHFARSIGNGEEEEDDDKIVTYIAETLKFNAGGLYRTKRTPQNLIYICLKKLIQANNVEAVKYAQRTEMFKDDSSRSYESCIEYAYKHERIDIVEILVKDYKM